MKQLSTFCNMAHLFTPIASPYHTIFPTWIGDRPPSGYDGRMSTIPWLSTVIGSDSLRTASAKARIPIATLSRHKECPPPETVIALCRAYGRDPIAGLMQTGYLHDHEIHTPSVELALRKATNLQILDELIRRSDPDAHHLFTPGTPADTNHHDNVIPLDSFQLPEGAVADSSPDEDLDS